MEIGTQGGKFKYEIRLSEGDRDVARGKESSIVGALEGDSFCDIDFDWDAGEGEENGEQICYATLTLSKEKDVFVEFGSTYYDEDNDDVIDAEPDMINDPLDPDDVTWDVKKTLSDYGITDVYTIDYWIDSTETVMDRIKEQARNAALDQRF